MGNGWSSTGDPAEFKFNSVLIAIWFLDYAISFGWSSNLTDDEKIFSPEDENICR